MGKENNPRRVADNEAMAKTKMLRTSPQKLNLVAALIRGKKVDKALADLTFSKKNGSRMTCVSAWCRQLPTLKTTTVWTLITSSSQKLGSAKTSS